MSRGFVKEDDQEEAPFIPPRAPLPNGVINYVTPRGLQLLEAERNTLESDRRSILEKAAAGEMSEDERRRDLAVLNGRLDLLAERIATAQVTEVDATPEEVRFGNKVTFRSLTGAMKGKVSVFTIIGVDEADVKDGRIAFTAPIARALIGRRAGDLATFQLGPQEQKLEILAID